MKNTIDLKYELSITREQIYLLQQREVALMNMLLAVEDTEPATETPVEKEAGDGKHSDQ